MPKQIISPGQAVLLLISFYKKTKSAENDAMIKKLTVFYLDGVKNPDEHAELRRFFEAHQGGVLAKYKIAFEPEVINEVINNDPSRRYFETHLAYEVLKHDVSKINRNHLISYVNNLEQYLKHYDSSRYDTCFKVLEGQVAADAPNAYKQYADYLTRLRSGELFCELTQEQKSIIELIIRSSFLAINCAQSPAIKANAPMPIDIYDTGLYSEDARGKKLLPTTRQKSPDHSGKTRSQHFGLMKNYMALARDDIAMAESVIPYLKPSDQATYMPHALWTKLNFSRLMHPFSNSISGSVLCQLRVLSYYNKRHNIPYFSNSHEEFQNFFKLYISVLLFYSGGHSLFELVRPLTLNPVMGGFNGRPINFNTLTIANMFTSSPEALNAALDKAIAYNNRHLLRQELNEEIRSHRRHQDEQPMVDAIPNVQEPRAKRKFEEEEPPMSDESLDAPEHDAKRQRQEPEGEESAPVNPRQH